jgi:hypothetical protein
MALRLGTADVAGFDCYRHRRDLLIPELKSGPAICCGPLQGIASKRFVSTYSYDLTGKDAGIEGQSIEPRIAGAGPIPFHDPRFQNPYFPQFRRG